MKTLWDKLIRNLNWTWLTKPDSRLQPPTGQVWPNRLKMLPESGFLATVPLRLNIKSRIQPTLETHPLRPGGMSVALIPMTVT